MNVLFNADTVVLGAIIAQGFFAGALLLFFKNNRGANRLLAALLIMLALWLCDTFFRVAGIYEQNPQFYFLPIYFSLAFGPLVYFYTRSLTERGFKLEFRHLWHFIPALLQLTLYVFLQLKSYDYRRWFWMEIHSPYTYNLEFILSLFSLLIYLALSLKAVRSYQKWIENNYSDISQIKLTWLKRTHTLLLVLSLLWLVDAVVRYFNYYPEKPFSTISIGFSILFLAIGALNQRDLKDIEKQGEPDSDSDINLDSSLNPNSSSSSGSSLNSGSNSDSDLNSNSNTSPISNSESAAEIEIEPELLSRIERAMEVDELYLRHTLTLREFAAELGITARKASRHINVGLELSFIDFVNGYRVACVKRKLAEGESGHLSLFGIALESGFNSKPTFNRVFKKMTGKKPLELSKNASK